MDEITIHVEVEINPTEDAEKVKLAVHNVVGNASITITPSQKGSLLCAEAKGQDSLIKFRNLMRNDRIRDASRRLLLKAMRGNMISFYLNKQVAFAGHVSFSEETAESPLGPIKINIETDNPQQLIEWLAEKTAYEK
jgi:uncharacterized protein